MYAQTDFYLGDLVKKTLKGKKSVPLTVHYIEFLTEIKLQVCRVRSARDGASLQNLKLV